MDIRLVWRSEGTHILKQAVTSIMIVPWCLAVRTRMKGVY
jgi:hypothetical protein